VQFKTIDEGIILGNRLPCIYAITYLWIISWSDFPCSDFIFLDQLCEVENIRYPIKIRRTRSTDYHVGMSESYWPTIILQKLHFGSDWYHNRYMIITVIHCDFPKAKSITVILIHPPWYQTYVKSISFSLLN
jgi:hypothetical protein